MTGREIEIDHHEAHDEGRRQVARTTAALDLARRNRDFLATDIKQRLEETGTRRAETAHRYALVKAAYNYALAVHATTIDDARTQRMTPPHVESEPTAAPVCDGIADRSSPEASPPNPIGVTVLPGAPLIESGFWALLRRYEARITPVPLGQTTDVVVAIVTPAAEAALPPQVRHPLVVIVPDRATADLVSRRGAVAVPMSATGAQLMAVLETVRTLKPSVPPRQEWAAPTVPLSRREAEVVTLICAGRTNPQIAAELYLGANSIKTYVRTAYKKMGVTRRAEAVLWGHHHGYAPTTTKPEAHDHQ